MPARRTAPASSLPCGPASGDNAQVNITARADYAIGAVLALAAMSAGRDAGENGGGRPGGAAREAAPRDAAPREAKPRDAAPREASGHEAVPAEVIAERADIPRKFLESILRDLRRADIVTSTRGSRGGYALARSAERIALGDIVRAVDGPLAQVRGQRPQETQYPGAAQHLPVVWVAVRASLRKVLDETSIADVLAGQLPAHVLALANDDDAWSNR